MLRDLEADFARYLLDENMSEGAIPLSAYVDAGRGAIANRIRVHRNNFFSSLIESLGRTYPVVEKLVGPAFFREIAREFIKAHPPRDPAILAYGDAFAGFIESFEAADSVPYLADTARLEWCRQHAYHAAEAHPLNMSVLMSLKPGQFNHLRLMGHPSLRFLASPYPIRRIWEVNSVGEDGSEPVSLAEGPDHLLIARPFSEVIVVSLSQATYRFARSVCTNKPLTEAYEITSQEHEDFDLQESLAALIACNVIVDYTTAET